MSPEIIQRLKDLNSRMLNITATALKRDNGDIRVKAHVNGEPIERLYTYQFLKDGRNEFNEQFIRDDFTAVFNRKLVETTKLEIKFR